MKCRVCGQEVPTWPNGAPMPHTALQGISNALRAYANPRYFTTQEPCKGGTGKPR